MKVYVALHEDRWPMAVFSSRESAAAWIAAQPEPDYAFDIREELLDLPHDRYGSGNGAFRFVSNWSSAGITGEQGTAV